MREPYRGRLSERRGRSGQGAGRAAGEASPRPRRPSREELLELLPADWRERSYLALDVETTGLDPRRCRVIELGALRFVPAEGHYGGPRLERLVDPGMPIPAATTAIHGITDAEVAGAPPFAALAAELGELARGAIIIAHNAPFDLRFIGAELERACLPGLVNPAFDSLLFAREAFPGLPSYSLPRLAASLGIAISRSHRALDDALVAARVFVEAAGRLRP